MEKCTYVTTGVLLCGTNVVLFGHSRAKKRAPRRTPPVLILFLPISAVESCLELSLLIFVAGLAEKSEHVLLVSLNAGLVERIYCEEVA